MARLVRPTRGSRCASGAATRCATIVPTIKSASASANPLDALIDINNASAFAERQKQVRDKLAKMVRAKRLGRMRYSRAEGGFIPLS